MFLRSGHYERESDSSIFWAEAESNGWVVMQRDYGCDDEPDVLYAEFALADAEARRLAAN